MGREVSEIKIKKEIKKETWQMSFRLDTKGFEWKGEKKGSKINEEKRKYNSGTIHRTNLEALTTSLLVTGCVWDRSWTRLRRLSTAAFRERGLGMLPSDVLSNSWREMSGKQEDWLAQVRPWRRYDRNHSVMMYEFIVEKDNVPWRGTSWQPRSSWLCHQASLHPLKKILLCGMNCI